MNILKSVGSNDGLSFFLRITVTRRTRITLGVIGSLAAILIALAFFARYQITKSFPQTEGSITCSGLNAPVEIVRDGYGVPSISASDEHDLFYALGFVHAQDRLWQMDMGRRVGSGRLSELFGSATVPFDKMFRILGLKRVAEEEERRLSPKEHDRLQWYADGVNAFILQNKGRYPVEFDLLRYEPELWQPMHSLLIGRVMFWELNLSWWTDLTYGAIAERVGLEKALDILPSYPADVPTEVPASVWRTYAILRQTYLSTAHDFAEYSGMVSPGGGSNAWAVARSKTAGKGVLLANDTHLRLQVPSTWYEVDLKAPTFHAGGMSLPGVPAIVAGRNDKIAWGVTNVMADDADFYVESIDSVDTTKYLYNGRWESMTLSREEIPVRGQSQPVSLTIRATRHGPVVTDIHTLLQKGSSPYTASMRWTGLEADDQLQAFDAIDRAQNPQEFAAALRQYPGPGQNFVYGDVDGNIGYWCALKLPIRAKKNSLLPLPGWDPANDWKGYVPFDMLPHIMNPPQGFIASANNKIVDDTYPYHISDLWEPPSRIERLHQTLSPDSARFTSEDFQNLQSDKYSFHAREILPYVLNAFRDSSLGLPAEDLIFEYLRNWNFVFSREDIATTIYQKFFLRLVHNIFADEMGEDLYHDWVLLTNVPIRVTTRLLKDSTSAWFDDIHTDSVETRDDIIRKSLREAVSSLEGEFGVDTKLWRWGDMHTVTLRHPFGLQKPLDKVFNLGPYPYGGGATTLTSGEFDFNDPFAVTVGPSYRQIFDMGNGEIRSVIPTGESGQVFHGHYHDQTQLWLNGVNRVHYWNEVKGTTLRLEPSR